MMDKLIQKENSNDIFCYMDNLTVAGHSQEWHDDNVKERVDVLGRYKFTLNDSKTTRSVSVIMYWDIVSVVMLYGLILIDSKLC